MFLCFLIIDVFVPPRLERWATFRQPCFRGSGDGGHASLGIFVYHEVIFSADIFEVSLEAISFEELAFLESYQGHVRPECPSFSGFPHEIAGCPEMLKLVVGGGIGFILGIAHHEIVLLREMSCHVLKPVAVGGSR